MTEDAKEKKTLGGYVKGALKGAFNMHANYFWPFSWKGVKTSALVMTCILPGMNAVMFPAAEEFAQKYDVPEHAVTELTGNVHTVVRSGLSGRIAAMYDFPPLMSLYKGKIVPSDEHPDILQSYAIAGKLFSYGGAVCRVKVTGMDENIESYKLLKTFSDLMDYQARPQWLSKQDIEDFKIFVFFHELRHCHPDNGAEDLREGDADYHAIKMVEKIRPQSNIREVVMTLRSLDKSSGHDTVLYLEDRFYHGGQKSKEQLEKYAENARDFINSGISMIRPDEYKKLPPLARRQVEIYKESLNRVTSKVPPGQKLTL